MWRVGGGPGSWEIRQPWFVPTIEGPGRFTDRPTVRPTDRLTCLLTGPLLVTTWHSLSAYLASESGGRGPETEPSTVPPPHLRIPSPLAMSPALSHLSLVRPISPPSRGYLTWRSPRATRRHVRSFPTNSPPDPRLAPKSSRDPTLLSPLSIN